MTERRTISITIPVYFNEDSLVPLHQRLTAVRNDLAAMGLGCEIIFVDDGSGDGSFARLMEIKASDPTVKVVRHARNFGAFAALKTGITYATGHAVVTLSADLQDPPELITDMAARWMAGEKFVIAVRATRDDSPSSKAFAAGYYRLLRVLVIPDYPEGGFDVMLVDRQMVPHLVDGPKNVNLHLYSYWLGFKPSVLPYDRIAREHGTSRWSFGRKLNLLITTLVGFSVRPMRLMCGFGMTASLLSFCYALFVIVMTLASGTSQPGFPTLAVLISFFSGLIIFMLGLVGEYLWRIFDAVNRKPEAVVNEVFL